MICRTKLYKARQQANRKAKQIAKQSNKQIAKQRIKKYVDD